MKRDLHIARLYLDRLLKQVELRNVKDPGNPNFKIKVEAPVHFGDYIFLKNEKKCNELAGKKCMEAVSMGYDYGSY